MAASKVPDESGENESFRVLSGSQGFRTWIGKWIVFSPFQDNGVGILHRGPLSGRRSHRDGMPDAGDTYPLGDVVDGRAHFVSELLRMARFCLLVHDPGRGPLRHRDARTTISPFRPSRQICTVWQPAKNRDILWADAGFAASWKIALSRQAISGRRGAVPPPIRAPFCTRNERAFRSRPSPSSR